MESANSEKKKWDVFISHASEDKDAFVRPLALALRQLRVSVWYDEFSLKIGNSITRSIDKGLAQSTYGIVVISPAFIIKPFPEYELSGLVTREIETGKLILPIWHGVSKQQVIDFSPPLADKLAIDTSRFSSSDISLQILQIVRPDLYSKHPRAQLERIASGEATIELQHEIERMREELESAKEELSEFQCPYCKAPLAERTSAPADPLENDWVDVESYVCGYQTFGGGIERPCPYDPNFPEFEDYDLKFQHYSDGKNDQWICTAFPKTKMAHNLKLHIGVGKTKKEAKREIEENYKRFSKKIDS